MEALRGLDACTLANAIETFTKRLRDEGFMDFTIHCLFPRLQPMLGYAATVKIRGSAPPTADGAFPDRTDWWDHIASQPAPRIVVIQDVATRPGLGALVGEAHMTILQAINCVGVVTNGSVRSLPAAERAGFHLFSGSVSVSHTYVHIIEIGTPVEIGAEDTVRGFAAWRPARCPIHSIGFCRADSDHRGTNLRPEAGADCPLPGA